MLKKLILLCVGLAAITFVACDDDITPEEQLELDKAILRAYIADKGLVVDSLPSGLYYVITKEGIDQTPPHPNINSTVVVGYKGYLLDSTVFDQTVSGAPVTLSLRSVIRGWQEGIPLIKADGRATLLIPSGLAYGTSGSRDIPPNTPLAFDIQLIDFL
jgi:FKBP-type peptidyl-prolyl cis-trans isomerase FkpA